MVSNLEEIVLLPATGQLRYRQVNAAPVIGTTGEIYGSVSVVRDITEQKIAEQALQESEKRMQLALQVSRSFTFEWRTDTDKVVRSDSCAKILGLSGDDIIHDTGSRYFERIYPEDRAQFLQILQELSSEKNKYETEYRVVHGDGHIVILEEAAQGEFNSDNRLIKLVGVTTDITQRKSAEEALEKLNSQLEDLVNKRTLELAESLESLKQEHTQRMKAMNDLREKDRMLIQQSRLAAMGEMLNNIAHQWRQPLNVVGLHLQQLHLLYESGDLNAETLDAAIQAGMQQIQHMSTTIDDFRNFFRPNKEKRNFTLNEAIKNTLSLIKDDLANKEIELSINLQESGEISGFFNEFCQALLSIVQNARDALMDRKVIAPKIEITSISEEGKIIITIMDNAGGIDPEVISRIFEPYFSTKGVHGTGIGLYMAKSIIDSMGGSITAFNTEKGAAFKLII